MEGDLAMYSKALHSKKICPRCGAAVHRSQMRGFLERGILRPVGVRAYRCSGCDERFLRFGGTKPAQTEAADGERGR
jgi:transposase-like protein